MNFAGLQDWIGTRCFVETSLRRRKRKQCLSVLAACRLLLNAREMGIGCLIRSWIYSLLFSAIFGKFVFVAKCGADSRPFFRLFGLFSWCSVAIRYLKSAMPMFP